MSDIKVISTTLTVYKVVVGAKTNQKLVDLQLSTWRGRSIPPNNIIRHWMEEPVKLLVVCFDPGLQVDKNWSRMMRRVDSLTQKWGKRKLSLKS